MSSTSNFYCSLYYFAAVGHCAILEKLKKSRPWRISLLTTEVLSTALSVTDHACSCVSLNNLKFVCAVRGYYEFINFMLKNHFIFEMNKINFAADFAGHGYLLAAPEVSHILEVSIFYLVVE